MVNKLQFLRSLNTGTSPVALNVGEIAFNLADKKLFVGNGSDTITRLDGSTSSVGLGQGYFESDLTTVSANAYTDQKIAELVDAAPGLLDTLNELAAAIADDPNFVTTVTTAVSGVQTNLNTEIARAQGAEGTLLSQIGAEAVRAEAAEAQLEADLATETARALAAEGAIAGDLATETARALAAENTISQAGQQAITAETQRAQSAENQLNNRLSAIESGIDFGSF
jgi:hypothetical protein